MQPTLLDAVTLYPSPIPPPHKSPFLVDILLNNQPKMQCVYNINGRALVVTVWDTQIDLHLAGPNNGQGDRITLPVDIIRDIVATVQ